MHKVTPLLACVILGCGVDGRSDSLLGEGQPSVDDAGGAASEDAGAFDADSPPADQEADGAPAAVADAAVAHDSSEDASVHVARDVHTDELRALADTRCGSCHGTPDNGIHGPGGAWPSLRETRVSSDLFPYPGMLSMYCDGWRYIAPGHPELSLLYMKLKPGAPCGAHPAMPEPPTAEEIELIGDAMRSWDTDGGAP